MKESQASVRALQELLDKAEIQELVIRYCHLIKARDLDGVVGLYSENAIFELPGGLEQGVSGAHTGRAAIRESLAVGLPLYEPWPFAHNHLVEILSADRARGRVHSEIRYGKRNLATGMVCAYEDDYVKEAGRWKFLNRKVTPTFLA